MKEILLCVRLYTLRRVPIKKDLTEKNCVILHPTHQLILLILFLRPSSSGAPSNPAPRLAQSTSSRQWLLLRQQLPRCRLPPRLIGGRSAVAAVAPPPRRRRPPLARRRHHQPPPEAGAVTSTAIPASTVARPKPPMTDCHRRCRHCHCRCRRKLRRAPPPSCCVRGYID